MPVQSPDIEEGRTFTPKFDEKGLLPAVVIDTDSQSPLMLAYMNQTALNLTIESKQAHFFSRSRGAIWKKGETSGQILHVVRILTDCDQDALVIEVKTTPPGSACHTGRTSCFYREVLSAETLKDIGIPRVADPKELYQKTPEET